MKYELLFFARTGESNPMDSLEEVQEAIFQETGTRIPLEQIQHGETFTNGEELLMINTYGSEEEE